MRHRGRGAAVSRAAIASTWRELAVGRAHGFSRGEAAPAKESQLLREPV
jgi:hypothetical protein